MSAVLETREPSARWLAEVQPALVREFELVTSAPGGVARLRELILLLAVQGKLVPQDPTDQSAHETLRRIKGERDRLIGTGKAKAPKSINGVGNEEPPFEIPSSWEWAALSDIVRVLNGRAYSKQELLTAGPTPVLRVGNLFTSDHWYYSDLDLDPDKLCSPGDLLFAWSASFGPFIWDGPKAVFHYHIWKLDPIAPALFDARFFHLVLREKTAELKAAGHGVSMVHLTKEKMEKIPVPWPPLAEQSRIVARVDELMRLCDALEAKGRLEAEQHARLLSTLLGTLTDSSTLEELAANWQRVADHFDLLLDRPEAVDALEQTILQLAVRGLLVSQDAGDVPADALSVTIQRSRKSKRRITAPDSDAIAEAGIDLPSGWVWCSVDQVSADHETAITDGPFGANLKTEHYVESEGFRVIRLQNIGAGVFRDEHRAYVDEDRYNRLLKHAAFPGDIVVAGLVDDSIRCCIVPDGIGPAIVKADCYRFSVHERVSSEYICLYLCSETAHQFASAHHHGLTLTRIGLGNFRSIPVPLPPAAEQRRIVARVSELRRLCADLRKRLVGERATQGALANALIDQAAVV